MACVKAPKYIDRVYSPERVLHPLVRKNGKWERASWDYALDLIAERMKSIRDEDGGEAILYYQGFGERTALKLLNRYFFNLFGGVTTLRGTLCGGTGQASQNLDLGSRISHDPLDHYNSASMVLWARNPVSTNISLVPIIQDIKKRGGRIIVVDPFRNKSVALADRHIAPAPGRDVYLAMAAAKVIFERGAVDSDFLQQDAVGANAFKAVLDSFSLGTLCILGGVSEDDVTYLANVLIDQRPTSMLLGWGLHRHQYAHYSIRAIDALSAICGNIGVAGGGVSQGFEEYGPFDQQFWGDQLNPPRRSLLMPRIGEEILQAVHPKIRMIFTTASNPVCMAPNSSKVSEAFRAAEFVVYSGHFMDDTADHAHVFLPATTFLEEDDVVASYGHNYVSSVNKAIEPVGECRSEFQMFYDLAGRFPFADRFRRSVDEWLHDICAPIREQGCSMEELRKGSFRLNAPMVPYSDRKFPTPSGKFEFMTSFDPTDLKVPDDEYPYALLTVAPHKHLCSERTLAEHEPLPVVLLHPEEAALRSLKDWTPVLVESPVGRVKALLKTDPGMRRDCLVGERGGWIKAGHGLNKLTLDIVSKVGDGAPYYDTFVRVRACEESASDHV
jgi:anaerobic selenocysteine-containing dehydrogenase